MINYFIYVLNCFGHIFSSSTTIMIFWLRHCSYSPYKICIKDINVIYITDFKVTGCYNIKTKLRGGYVRSLNSTFYIYTIYI
jgi:hypothetical protein